MDTFTVNGKLSLNVSGVGFDGHIANLFSGKTRRGLLGYAQLSLREFLKFKPFEGTLEINGQTLQRKMFILAIANSSQYGNNARVAPAASVCDRQLHINILKKIPLYRLDFILDMFKGRLVNSPLCEILESDKLTFSTQEPISYHVDGEPSGTEKRFEIVLQPAALQVLVPEKTEEGRIL
jgi:diacylglycerol kinase family enzyme